MKIGIVGNGYVGQATALLEREEVEVLIWDIDKEKRNIDKFKDLSDCDLVFVCVPTPMNKDGSCHTKIVENVVSDLIGLEIRMSDIIVRSTVPVGTCERLGVSFMPEFLTEANWKEDFRNIKKWIFGFDPPEWMEWETKPTTRTREKTGDFWGTHGAKYIITETEEKKFHFLKLARMWSKEVDILTTKEAELAKYARNVFLATKVSFFNEIEEFCRSLDISYENVRRATCMDGRIGTSHTQVPGPDGKRGFGGTCFPKDTASLDYQMAQHGVESYIIESAKARNLQVDRPEKDWEKDKGRAII